MSIGRLFDISVRSMSAYQQALDVTSNNISNASNPAYSRQKVILSSEVAENGTGVGVKVQDVLRIKNDLLGVQIAKYQSTLADADKRSEMLRQVESIISEPSSNGLSNYITEFFNSWDQLSTNPNSIPIRLNVIQKAKGVGDRFKQILDGLDVVQSTLLTDANATIIQINDQLKQIGDFNSKIYEAVTRGLNANELKDQRDEAIAKLSKKVNLTVHFNETGSANVSIGGVQGADQYGANQFEMMIIDGKMRMVSTSDSTTVAVVNSGELYAITDLYTNKTPQYKSEFENLQRVFVNKVNDLHLTGNSLIQGVSSKTNVPFFGDTIISGVAVDAISNGQININSSILSDPKNIAVSEVANNDGNGGIANKIARLFDSAFGELNNQSFMDYYSTTLNSFGMEKVSSDNSVESSSAILQQLNNERTSYSGVSLDEEMTNVLRYQRSYDAAAKMIKVADEMIQTILQMV